jgi:hypothetical protein
MARTEHNKFGGAEVRNGAGEDGLCRRERQRRRLTAHPATVRRSPAPKRLASRTRISRLLG